MYIGDTQKKGFHHMVWEILDNSIDEHMGGYCDRIEMSVHADGSVSVKDNGRGIPVNIHPEEKVAAATVVVTVLHAGGKFGGEEGESAYKTSGGLHGVGASVVNALSTRFEMTIERDGGKFFQAFENGGTPVEKLKRIGNSSSHGTTIRFWPDLTIFKAEESEPDLTFDHALIAHSLSTRAHLNPGLQIVYTDERTGVSSEWRAESFVEILDVVTDNRNAPVLQPLSAQQKVATKEGEVEVMVAFRVHAERPSTIVSFANGVTTPMAVVTTPAFAQPCFGRITSTLTTTSSRKSPSLPTMCAKAWSAQFRFGPGPLCDLVERLERHNSSGLHFRTGRACAEPSALSPVPAMRGHEATFAKPSVAGNSQEPCSAGYRCRRLLYQGANQGMLSAHKRRADVRSAWRSAASS